MSQDLGRGTLTGEHEPPEVESPNTKIHGEVPHGSPMPGAEREGDDTDEIKQEIKPNTE
ncbi:MAG TPA: hypothetical protein VE642_07005 [Pyrinomonadaceae bacterium]|nr:hypothetical protein [Pyrinomonadaceae bacterium]